MIINVFKWAVCVIYGGLTLVASIVALVNGSNPIGCIIMAVGAALMLITNIKPLKSKWNFVLIPLLLIHISAVINGFYMGGINISHHVVRLVISSLIFLLFFLSREEKNYRS